MTRRVYVSRPVHALGAIEYSVEDSARQDRLLHDVASFREAGFVRHHVATGGAYDLARSAVRQLDGELHDVDAVIYATCLPQNAHAGNGRRFEGSRDVKHLMDYPASRLQFDFGLDGAQLLGMDFERVAMPTLPDVGHVISGDNLINLAALERSGWVKSGQKLLMFMAGYGLHWQSVVLEKI